MTEGKVIYGDGHHQVEVAGDEVVFLKRKEPVTSGYVEWEVALRVHQAAFREVVIGWQRLNDQKSEEES